MRSFNDLSKITQNLILFTLWVVIASGFFGLLYLALKVRFIRHLLEGSSGDLAFSYLVMIILVLVLTPICLIGRWLEKKQRINKRNQPDIRSDILK